MRSAIRAECPVRSRSCGRARDDRELVIVAAAAQYVAIVGWVLPAS
jgi:hypothetical protein